MLCIQFIEYLFAERQEESITFGDRLGELYLRQTVKFKKARSSGECKAFAKLPIINCLKLEHARLYSKLLAFVNTSKYYDPDRLYALLPQTGMFNCDLPFTY